MKFYIHVILLLALMLSAGVSTADDDVYVISADKSVSRFPQEVVRFGGGKLFEISGLEVKSENGRLKASFSYIGKLDAVEFEVVLCTETERELLITFFHEDSRVTIFSPEGSAGNVALTMGGYENEAAKLSTGALVPEGYTSGIFRLSLATDIYGSYDIDGKEAKVTVFLVNKDENTRDGRFQAISDVLASVVTSGK